MRDDENFTGVHEAVESIEQQDRELAGYEAPMEDELETEVDGKPAVVHRRLSLVEAPAPTDNDVMARVAECKDYEAKNAPRREEKRRTPTARRRRALRLL